MDNREKIYEYGGELRNVQDLFEITANHIHYRFRHVNSLIYKYNSILDRVNMVKILKEDDELEQKLGANGKKIAKENLYWDRMANAAERIYISLS